MNYNKVGKKTENKKDFFIVLIFHNSGMKNIESAFKRLKPLILELRTNHNVFILSLLLLVNSWLYS